MLKELQERSKEFLSFIKRYKNVNFDIKTDLNLVDYDESAEPSS